MANILVVDDEKSICELLQIAFRKEGHKVETALTGEAAQKALASRGFDIVISDIRLRPDELDSSGVELLKYAKEVSPATVFILITGVPRVETAIEALNFGADRYVIKGDKLTDELRQVVRQASEHLQLKREATYLRRELRRLTGFDKLIGQSPKMRAVFELIGTVAPQTSRVLITGESGTGKELVARAIHENSPRAQAPFISINCGAFPETLLESELFGYLKGAFTGASENRQGLFQAADQGTLFLDEIADMSLAMQVKLFRVLQEQKVRPLGSTEEVEVDVRVIAATNKNLEKEITEGRFREDLFYRISVIPIHLPPLRERREDIALLARTFLERFRKEMKKPVEGISPEASERLEAYDWPGNVRELENTIERAVALETGPQIAAASLPEKVRLGRRTMPVAGFDGQGNVELPEDGLDFKNMIEDTERAFILAALERSGGVQRHAAKLLHLSYDSFRHYLKKHRIE